jgi:ABC-type molybdate transport system substrate-binding protein
MKKEKRKKEKRKRRSIGIGSPTSDPYGIHIDEILRKNKKARGLIMIPNNHKRPETLYLGQKQRKIEAA